VALERPAWCPAVSRRPGDGALLGCSRRAAAAADGRSAHGGGLSAQKNCQNLAKCVAKVQIGPLDIDVFVKAMAVNVYQLQ